MDASNTAKVQKEMKMIMSNEKSRAKAVKDLSFYGVAKVVKVSGGYMGFESAEEYKTWKNQK